jgi:hypothetical protein
MLFGMTGGAQRNRIAITGLNSNATIGSRTNMRSLRWRRLATGDAGKLTDKSQMFRPSTEIWLGFAARNGVGDTGGGHRYKGIVGALVFSRAVRSDSRQ